MAGSMVSLKQLTSVTFVDVETTGLDPFRHRIVSIQVRRAGRNHIWPEWELGELKTLESFFDFLKGVERKNEIFVGYNVLKFDVSFIDQRLRELVLMNQWKWRILHDWLHWFDLYHFLGDAYFRFRDWMLGIAGIEQEYEGREIPILYSRKEYEKILGYINNELLGLELTYKAILKEKFYNELEELRTKIGSK